MSQQYVFLVKKNSKLRKLQKTQYYFLVVNELWSDAGALIQCPLLGNGEGNHFEYTRAAQQCIPHGSKWEQKANSHLNGMFAVHYITTKNVRRVLPCKITSKFTSKAGELVTTRQVYSIRKKTPRWIFHEQLHFAVFIQEKKSTAIAPVGCNKRRLEVWMA